MKALHIRNLPETTLEMLKRRARRHRRSLQGEIHAMLSEAVRQEAAAASDAGGDLGLNLVRTEGRQDWSREGIYED